MRSLASWIAAGAALLLLLGAAAVAAINWRGIGDVGIDASGWIAMALGILATLAIGIALMALVFISNRRGYDEPPRDKQ